MHENVKQHKNSILSSTRNSRFKKDYIDKVPVCVCRTQTETSTLHIPFIWNRSAEFFQTADLSKD